MARGDGAGMAPSRLCPCPTAVVATLLYALWPAGVALASVVGTDVPAASLIMLALWALVAWGERRPIAAALGFGALMGLAAYVRAVALPLTLMSVVYWAVRRGRKSWRQVALLTALTTAATLVVLLPWAVRNQRLHGALKFTDDHGGITALIGANPNSEGTYTRALNRMFKDLTGRTVLDEPHARDRPAGVRSRQRLDALRAALRAGAGDPQGRAAVLVGVAPAVLADRAAGRAGRRARALVRGAHDRGQRAGRRILVCAVRAVRGWRHAGDRRAPLAPAGADPVPARADRDVRAFFAEPRYRVPIEMMAFPLAAFALRRLWFTLRVPDSARARARPPSRGW